MNNGRRNLASPAFTLPEILIAIAIGGIVLLAAVSFLFSFILNLEQTDEHTAAIQRAEMVLTILSSPVLQSGIGMPTETADFQDSLNGLSAIAGWNGPVEVLTTTNVNDTIRIVYGVGTDLGLEEFGSDTVSDGEPPVTLTLSGPPPAGTFSPDAPESSKGWCLLPASDVPLRITAPLSNNTMSVTVASGSPLGTGFNRFDQVHLLRRMEAGVTTGADPAFYTNDLMGGGEQPRVQGISGLHFEFDSDTGVISVVVLARGNKRHDEQITPSAPAGWDPAWGFSTEDTHYRLSVLQTAWRIRN